MTLIKWRICLWRRPIICLHIKIPFCQNRIDHNTIEIIFRDQWNDVHLLFAFKTPFSTILNSESVLIAYTVKVTNSYGFCIISFTFRNGYRKKAPKLNAIWYFLDPTVDNCLFSGWNQSLCCLNEMSVSDVATADLIEMNRWLIN